jgi:protein gp37
MASKNSIKNPTMSDNGKNWNVITGCDKYSDGCLNCYAENQVKILQKNGIEHYLKNGFNLTMRTDKLDWPFKYLAKNPRQPAKCFVTGMGDPFHDAVTEEFLMRVFDKMLKIPQHRFFVLTKRAERLGELGQRLPWKSWIWAGVTVESDKYIHRIDHLKKLPKSVNKFLMIEPLLGPMPELDLEGIHWVAVGGETNSQGKYRRVKNEWVTDIRDQVKKAGLPFLFKHWPGEKADSKPALLEGKIWDEYPESLLSNQPEGVLLC